MKHEQLATVIKRYTPKMLQDAAASTAEQVRRLETHAGTLPESYRDFLNWMGERCQFLDIAELAYSPQALLRVYEDPDDAVPEGFLLAGIDNSGNGYDVHIRRSDGAVVLLGEFFDAASNPDLLLENLEFTSFLFRTYVERTLVAAHPFHFGAALQGEAEQLAELLRRVEEACSHFAIPYRADFPDFRFRGGDDFVMGLYQRPQSDVLSIFFGAIERARYEVWYDLIFARWRLQQTPLP